MRYVKWISIGLPVLGVAWVVWWYGLNYAGYCHAEGRYLSEREQIEAAIRAVLVIYPPTVDLYEIADGERRLTGRAEPSDPIPYADIADFLGINERCCELTEIGEEGYTIPWDDRVSGKLSTLVRVKYVVRYDDRYGNRFSEPAETIVGISNCGRRARSLLTARVMFNV
jgi:hypothetical protein